MPASWDDLCARGASYGNSEVIGRLLTRGFRLDEDILLFDRFTEFATDLACWKALILGGGYGAFDAKTLQALDRHEELKTAYVFVADNLVEVKPASGRPGTTVTGGPIDNGGAQFNYDPTQKDSGISW